MKKITLVVVDDNLVSRLLPGFILRPLCMAALVLECESGAEAMRLIEVHQITHVLLDISMPTENGIAVAKKIRSLSKYADIRLIAYTADVLAMDLDYIKCNGFDDVLLKPLKRIDLLRVLNVI
jgi:two-component system, sensor histidine kinase and response regulator